MSVRVLRSRLARLGLAVALASSALVLSGCGDAGVAARVDGQVITEQDVSALVREVNEQLQPTQPVTPDQALTLLIQSKAVLPYADTHGLAQTESAARASYPVIDPSPATVEVFRMLLATGYFTEVDKIAVTKDLGELDVTVNPKYGAYDPARAVVGPSAPDWIKGTGAR